MTQSTVSATRQRAFPGMLVDSSPKVCDSKVNGEASAEMRFGIMVKQDGTSEEKVKLLTAIAEISVIAGVVAHRHDYAKTDEVGDTGVKAKISLDVLAKGRVWVIVEEGVTVTPDDPVHCRFVATGNEIAGSFRISADGTDTVKLNARWLGPSQTYTPPGGSAVLVAPLELDVTSRGATPL